MQLPVKPGRSVGSIWLVFFFSGLGRAGYLRSVVESQVAAARDFQAHALFTDIDPTAFLTAKILGLPMATTFAQVLQVGRGAFPWRRMNAAVHSIQRAFGLPRTTVDELFLDPQVLKIIPSIPELDGTDAHRPDVCYVGSLIEPL